MKLTDETIKRIRHNKYSVDCIQGICTLSDGDIIANLCDTIEALRQENERLKQAVEVYYDTAKTWEAGYEKLKQENERLKALADVDPETLSVLIRQYVNENDDKLSPDAQQLKQQLIDAMRDYRNPADVEALKVAREVLRALNQADWCDCDHCKGVREALTAIDKIGGREDV